MDQRVLFFLVMLFMKGIDEAAGAITEKPVINLCRDELTQMQTDLIQQMREAYSQQKKIFSLELEIKSLQANFSDLQSDRSKEQISIRDLQAKLNGVENLVQQLKQTRGGVTYTRWGRTTCPESATILYTGHVGGNIHEAKGGGSNYLCLPGNPEWGNIMDGFQFAARIYGAEYESANFEGIFSKVHNGGRSLHDLDPLCVVCFASTRSTQIMIPARRSCPAGWTMEYRGYLVTEFKDWNIKDFVCLDEEPEAMPGSQQNLNGALFYAVEGVCGSLPCPPYVDGWELSCVVCSK